MEDILPYSVAFLCLVLLFLVVGTWTLWTLLQVRRCNSNPHIWCADTWKCANVCTPSQIKEQGLNPCFGEQGKDNLASCLFGVDSQVAQASNALPPPQGVSWPCQLSGKNNCLANCPGELGEVTKDTVCCAEGAGDNGRCPR